VNDLAKWWQSSKLEDFERSIDAMPMPELQALAREMSAALSDIQSQVESAQQPQREWIKRANRAKGLIAQRKSLVKRQMILRTESAAQEKAASRQEKAETRRGHLELAREHLESGRLALALALVLDGTASKGEL
jgi:hypothetical protein